LNGISAVLMMKLLMFRNSFGILMAFHSLSNVGVLAIFLLWVAPTTNAVIGQLAILFQTLSFHTILFVAVNRFTAISFPALYRNYFTLRNTVYIIAFISFVSISYFCVYFHRDCLKEMKSLTLQWKFQQTECGTIVSFYVDLVYSVALFAVVTILDLVTLLRLRQARTVIFIRWFQALTNSIAYCFMLISFHFISYQLSGIANVLATTIIWEAIHLILSFRTYILARFLFYFLLGLHHI
uniref:7TM_GPCR_Srx domain-containing protein n=1 Tax=Heligmosomoides polygyrus TaxID=6339 RepID=A0A183FW44_HELPZ